VLADELAAPGDRPVSERLASYEAKRAPRAMRVQRAARTWGEIWHVDGVAKLLRDELLLSRDVADHKHVEWFYRDYAAVPAPQAQEGTDGHRQYQKENAP